MAASGCIMPFNRSIVAAVSDREPGGGKPSRLLRPHLIERYDCCDDDSTTLPNSTTSITSALPMPGLPSSRILCLGAWAGFSSAAILPTFEGAETNETLFEGNKRRPGAAPSRQQKETSFGNEGEPRAPMMRHTNDFI